VRFAVLIVAAAIAAMPPAAARQSSNVSRVEVAVAGADGAPAPGLTREDFRVSIDGAPATLASFAGPEEPLTIVLLFDVTSSLTNYGSIGGEIERSFVKALTPKDRVRIGGIGNRLRLSPRFTSDVREIVRDGRAAIRFPRRERSGPSPIWDAMAEAIRILAPESGRRVIILVSDARASGNSIGAQEVVERAVAAGIVVSGLSDSRTLTISQSGNSIARVDAGLMMRELARLSGGLCLPENPPEYGELPPPGPLLTQLVQDARGMYTLGVSIGPGVKPLRRLEVLVGREGLTVRARPALVAGRGGRDPSTPSPEWP
jgi:VWFA-related protein